MTTSGMRGIDLFKIAGRSISGWIAGRKTGTRIMSGSRTASNWRNGFTRRVAFHPAFQECIRRLYLLPPARR